MNNRFINFIYVFSFNIILISYYSLNTHIKLVMLLLINLKSYTTPHNIILLWLFSSAAFINYNVLDWALTPSNHNYLDLKFNNVYIELTSPEIKKNYFIDLSWSFLNKTSVPLNQSFSHLLNENWVSQRLHYFSFEFNHWITIFDYTIVHLLFMALSWSSITLYLIKKSKVIVF